MNIHRSCPVCERSFPHEKIIFAHFIGKHPLEYINKKRMGYLSSLFHESILELPHTSDEKSTEGSSPLGNKSVVTFVNLTPKTTQLVCNRKVNCKTEDKDLRQKIERNTFSKEINWKKSTMIVRNNKFDLRHKLEPRRKQLVDYSDLISSQDNLES